MKKILYITLLLCISIGATAQTADELSTLLQGTTAPKQITDQLTLVEVEYLAVSGDIKKGAIVVNSALRSDIEKIFSFALSIDYPIDMIIPLKFDLPNGETSMRDLNNTTSFFYRHKFGGKKSLSLHSYGRAFDINPDQNPYIAKSGLRTPKGAIYDTTDTRTLTKNHPLVKYAKSLGWVWGGDWRDPKDYMHFEKRN